MRLLAGVTAAILLAPILAAASERKCPQVHIMMDRSKSMDGSIHFGTLGPRRWDVARIGVTGFVGRFENRVRFGFGFFAGSASGGGDKLGATSGDDCAPGLNVYAPDYGRAAEIAAALATLAPATDTPTRATIESLQDYKPLFDPRYDNYLLLLTDGLPNCYPSKDIFDPERKWTAVPAIAALRATGVQTIVVGFAIPDASLDAMVLDEMAAAGGLPRMAAPGQPLFYPAADPTSLDAVLDEISSVIRSAGTLPVRCEGVRGPDPEPPLPEPPTGMDAAPPHGAHPGHVSSGCGCRFHESPTHGSSTIVTPSASEAAAAWALVVALRGRRRRPDRPPGG